MKEMLPSTFASRVLRSFFAFLLLIAIAAPARGQTLSMNVGESLGTVPIGQYQYGLVAGGGTGSYTWTIVGDLPPGLALRTDILPSWFPPGSTAGIVGVATETGLYEFTVRVTSGAEVVEQPTSLKVTAFTAKEGWEIPPAVKGQAYSYQLQLLNAAGPKTWSVDPASMPPGLTMNASGLISGSPSATGGFNIPYTASDGTDWIGRSVHLEIQALAITNADFPTVFPGVAYSEAISVVGGTGPYTFSATSLPPGLTLNPTTGVISGTTTWGSGRWGFSVTVTDSTGASQWHNLALILASGPSHAPIIRPYGGRFQDCVVGSACRLGIEVESGEGPFTWSVSGEPAGMSVTRYGEGHIDWLRMPDGGLWGTPIDVGDYQIEVRITDRHGVSTTNVFPLHVSPLAFMSEPFSATLGSAMNVPIRIIGGTGSYTITYAPMLGGNERLPVGVSLTGNAYVGTPIESGWFNPYLLVTDAGGATLFASLGFPVNSSFYINNGPSLWTQMPGNQYSMQLSACCTALNEYTWETIQGTLPTGLTLSTTGLLSGTLTGEGYFTFVIQATDAHDPSKKAAAQFWMTVTSMGITGNWTLRSGNVGTTYSHTFTASGGVTPYRFRLQNGWTLPPGLTLTPGGVLAGTPQRSGSFHFGIELEDSAGHINFANIYLYIYPNGVTPPIYFSQGPSFGPYAFGSVEFPLVATGGDETTYAWSLIGTPPPGLALRTPPLPMGPWFNPVPQAEFAGIPTQSGTFNFTFRVASGGAVADQAATVRVSPVHSTDLWNLPDGFLGHAYSYTLGIDGCSQPVSFEYTSGLPPGLSMDAAGAITGTPTLSGFYNTIYRVVCPDNPAEQLYFGHSLGIFDIYIQTPGELPVATQNAAYNATIVASGGAGGYKYTVGWLPNGLNINEDTGVISGTVNTGPGKYGISVTATDSAHVSYTKQMAIDVLGVPPTLPSVSIDWRGWDDCTFGISCSRGAYVNNGGTPPFTWSATGLPAGMNIRWGSANTQNWGTPGNLQIYGVPTELGSFPIVVTVTDANNLSTSNTFTLGISPLWLRDFWGHAIRGEAYHDQLRIIGGVPPYTTQILEGKVPAGLTYNAAQASLDGTPLENGWFDFLIEVRDSATPPNTLRQRVSVEVGGGTTNVTVNTSDLGRATIGQPFNGWVNACCSGFGFTWAIVNPANPLVPISHPWLTLSASPDGRSGVLTGTPPAGTVGPVTLFVKAADAANANNYGIREVTIAINSAAFNINGFAAGYANVGTPYSITLTTTGGTAPVTWALAPHSYLPPDFTLTAGGVLSGTPTSAGSYSISLVATDAAGNQATYGFSLRIYPPNGYPPLQWTGHSSPMTLSLGTFTTAFTQTSATGGKPPYRFSVAPGSATIPGVRFQEGGPYPTNYQPESNYSALLMGVLAEPGQYSTTIRVTDSDNNTADRTITVTVPSLTVLSHSNAPAATRNVFYAFAMEAYGGGPSLSWTANSMPPGLSIDSTGVISGTPTTAGTYNPYVSVTDLASATTVGRTITINVNAFAILTSGVLPTGTSNVVYPSLTLSAPDCVACTWSWSGNIPSGLSLSSAGVISGTPNGSYNGTVTIRANGTNGTSIKTCSLIILNPSSPTLTVTTSSINDGFIGQDLEWQLNANGGTPPYTWSLAGGTLPDGVTLGSGFDGYSSRFAPGMGYLRGRALEGGTFTFTARVTDSVGATATRAFTWNVSRLSWQYYSLPVTYFNGTSQVATIPLKYNESYSQPLLVLGGTGNYASWAALSALPPGLSLNTATGLVSGTPSNTGSFNNVMIRATDSGGNTVVGNVNFNVAGPTSTTLFLPNGALGTVQGGSPASFGMTPSGGTPPYTLTALSALPPGFEIVPSGQGIVGGPSSGFNLAGIGTAPGTYSFTIQATDAAGNIGVRTFTLSVASFVLWSSTSLPNGSVGVPYALPLTAFSSAGPVTFALGPNAMAPPGLSLAADGTVSGTPTVAGTFSFQVLLSDGTYTLNRTLTVKISPLAIAGNAILPAATTGSFYSYTFTATGGAVLWSISESLPAGLALDAATGILSGTPTGRNTFSLTVTATSGASSVTRRFMLPVYPAIPFVLDVPADDTDLGYFTVGQSIAVQLFANSGAPPYTWSAPSGLPAGLALVSGAQNWGVTPGTTSLAGIITTPGTYTFDLVATDSAGATARRTYTLRVSPIGIYNNSLAPGVTGTAYFARFLAVGGTGSYTFTARATDPYQDVLPPGLSLSTDGVLSGTPTSTGGYSFFLHVTDGSNVYERFVNFTINSPAGFRISNSNPGWYWIGSGRSMRLTTQPATGPATTAVYSWSVAPGSNPLPPGMALVPGLSPTPPNATWLAGAPSAAGSFTFTLRATDTSDSALTADHTFTVRVGEVQIVVPAAEVINVVDVPSAQVGTPYSVTLKAAGGHPGYTFAQHSWSALPPGITLAGDGTLSGTPAPGSSGYYQVLPVVTDSLGHVSEGYPFNFYVTPAGVPAPLTRLSAGLPAASVGVPYAYGLDLMLRGGTRPFTWTVTAGALPPGLRLVTDGSTSYIVGRPTAETPFGGQPFQFTLTATDSGMPAQSVSLAMGMRISALAMTPDALPTGLVGSPYSQTLTVSGGTGPYGVNRLPQTGLPPGLTLTNGVLSGTPTHAGNFVMQVFGGDSANHALTKLYTVTIDNALGEAAAIGLTPAPISVYYERGNPNPAPIPLSVTTTHGTIPFTIAAAGIPGLSLSAAAGTAPATIALTIDAASLAEGTYHGVVGIDAPQSAMPWVFVPVTLTVAPPPPCTYTVSPTASTLAGAAGSGSFGVTAGPTCAWTATSSAPAWLTVTSGAGPGNGTVSFSAAANTAPSQRSATITVNGAVHTVTQFGTACSFTISPLAISATSAGGTATVNVTASNAACAWTASSASMVLVPSGPVGNGKVTATVPANPLPAPRVLTATIAGKTFTVNQAGIDCVVTLSPYEATVPAAASNGSVAVTTAAGCGYDTVAGPSWIAVTSGGTGSGPGTLVYTVDANSTTLPRTGTLTIGGQSFTITQEALACSVTVDTTSLGSPYGSSAAVGTIAVTTNGSNCSWAASSGASWATLTKLSGTGNGTIGVSVGSNAGSTTTRTGTLTIAGQTVNISQAGTACSYALESTTGSAPSSGGNGTVRVLAPSVCGWSAASNTGWLTITSSGTQGSSEVQFSAMPNGSADPRSGTLTIAGTVYTVTQAGAPCSYAISGNTTSPLIADTGGSGSFDFTASFPSCTPTAASFAGWVHVDSIAFSGTTGTVNYTAAANPFSVSRSGTLQVGNATYTVVQTGADCSYGLNYWGKVFNAAGGSSAILGTGTALGCTPVYGTDQPSFITLGTLTGPTGNIFTLPYSVAPFPASLTGGLRFGTITFGGQVIYIKQYSW